MDPTLEFLLRPEIIIPLGLWSLAWKGTALWKAARNNQLKWFVALLIINTMGLLEIIYISWLQKKVAEKK